MGRLTNIPFVSIIVPCYNEELFLPRCLGSLLNQNYPVGRFEVIVVDGMSNDRSREIAQEYSKKYPHVKMVDNPRKSAVFAFNAGVRSVREESAIYKG